MSVEIVLFRAVPNVRAKLPVGPCIRGNRLSNSVKKHAVMAGSGWEAPAAVGGSAGGGRYDVVLVILQRQVLQSCFDPGLVPQLQFIDRVDSVRDGVLPVLSSAVNRDRYPQLLCFSAWVSGLLQYFDKVVDVPAEACGKMSHNFFVLLALFAWNLDLISSSPLFCQPLAPVRCDSPRRLLTKFFQFPREKWTPITLQFTLGNLELFLRPVSGSHRVRQSTLLLEEFHIFSSC